jgi:Cft2 family RNA processing exonuclease
MTYRLTDHRQTNFRQGHGKVYMTHPTKALYKLVMQDLLSAECVANSIFPCLVANQAFQVCLLLGASLRPPRCPSRWLPSFQSRCMSRFRPVLVSRSLPTMQDTFSELACT